MTNSKDTKTTNKSQDVAEVTEVQEETEKEIEEENKPDNEIEVLKSKVAEADNNYKRALADYQNLQRRVQEEKIQWIQLANKELLLKLLPVLDTLLLAQKHINDQGLALSIQQFSDVLEKEGVKKIETKDKQFDPLIMECVETREGEDWKVLEEVKSGYKFGEVVLRPAVVVVGKKKE